MIDWDKDVLSIHVTEECNMRCKYCYIDKIRSKECVTKEYIDKSIEKLNNINTLFLYGGEPLLHKDIVKYVIDKYSKTKSVIIATNGTLLDDFIMKYFISNNVGVMISLDSFNYKDNIKTRYMNEDRFNKLISLITEYSEYDKLGIFLTINHDTTNINEYFNILNELSIRNIEVELAVAGDHINIENTWIYKNIDNLHPDIKRLFSYRDKPSTLQKLRLLPNGIITRNHIDNVDDYIDHCYNIDTVDVNKLNKEAELPKTCSSCKCNKYCSSYNVFPNLIKDLENKAIDITKTFFCQLAKEMYKKTNIER